jgi:hypothetical protein
MMTKLKSKRKPTSTSGKDAPPRGGLKAKQTRVATAKRTEPPGPQQTKLSFSPTLKIAGPPTPQPFNTRTVITLDQRVTRLPDHEPFKNTELSNTTPSGTQKDHLIQTSTTKSSPSNNNSSPKSTMHHAQRP